MFSVAEYRVHLLTTAGVPHPLAALPEPRGPGEFLPPPHTARVVSTTVIFWDLIAWSASTNPGQILVWNWKTGDVLLRITPYALDSCYKFLDASHLLVLFDQDIRIYDFSPSPSPSLGVQVQDQDPPAAPLTMDDCPCVLRLPPVAHEAVHSMDPKLFVPHSPSASPNSTPPPFRHDPALKVVCLAFSLISIAPGEPLSHRVERYMFLFPASALLAEFQRVRGGPAGMPPGHGVDIPWEEWGPRSCRVFRTATSSLDSDCVGVSGTKVVLSRRLGWDEDGRGARMQLQVVDVNPFASVDPPSIPAAAAGEHVASLLPLADPGEDGCIADCLLFRGGSVRSELPYASATHEVELELEDGVDARRDDGRFRMFVFEDRWMFLYTQRSDPAAPTPFTATGVHMMQI